MMKIRVLSDLHLEYQNFNLTKLEDDSNTIMILAGDIGVIRQIDTILDFLELCNGQFRHTFYVPGNHEYYGTRLNNIGPIHDGLVKRGLSKITVMHEGQCLSVDDVLFIGATLWTDFSYNELIMNECHKRVNDFYHISYGPGRLKPVSLLEEHEYHLDFIKYHLMRDTKKYSKRIVMTHHLPSYKSVPTRFQGSIINGSFVSDLEAFIQTYSPDLWIHGHCIDLKSEILTESGWKRREDISNEDRVYSYDKDTNLLILNNINEIIDTNYTGNVFSYTGKGIDLRVTENHCMVGMNYTRSRFLEEPAPVFFNRKSCRFIRSGVIDRPGCGLDPSLLELYIALAADGDLCNKDTSGLVRFSLWKDRKLDYIENLLKQCGIPFNIVKNGYSFYLPDELMDLKIKGLDDFILNCNQEECNIILRAYINTDGSVNNDQVCIYTSKKSEADLLQHLFTINGFKSNSVIREPRSGNDIGSYSVNTSYEIYVKKGSHTTAQFKIRSPVIEKVVNEKFWCIRCDYRNFFIRRNGKVHLTGNSHDPCDYKVGGTRVVCNPRGYPNEISRGFDPDYLIEI